jgi:hypothetical protein
VTIAYFYTPFSSAEQKKGDSLRRQMQLSDEYARRHNLTIDTTLHLHDLGMSAFNRSNITKGALGGFSHPGKLLVNIKMRIDSGLKEAIHLINHLRITVKCNVDSHDAKATPSS